MPCICWSRPALVAGCRRCIIPGDKDPELSSGAKTIGGGGIQWSVSSAGRGLGVPVNQNPGLVHYSFPHLCLHRTTGTYSKRNWDADTKQNRMTVTYIVHVHCIYACSAVRTVLNHVLLPIQTQMYFIWWLNLNLNHCTCIQYETCNSKVWIISFSLKSSKLAKCLHV